MYRIGFRIEPRDRTGFAHLFEHMMFQGSEHVPKFEHVQHRQRERRDAERIHALRSHELLRGDAVQRARAGDVARGRPDALAEDHAGDAEEPAGRRQRRGPRQRAQPAVRRVRVARAAAEGEHQLVQRAQLLRRSVRPQGGEHRRCEEVLRHLLRAEQRRPRRLRRHDGRRGDEAGGEAFRRDPAAAAAAASGHQGAAADRGEELHRERQARAHAGASPSAITCRIG